MTRIQVPTNTVREDDDDGTVDENDALDVPTWYEDAGRWGR